MPVVDDLMGVAVVGLGAAVALKVTQSAFDWASPGKTRRPKKQRRARRRSVPGLGDFSNLGI